MTELNNKLPPHWSHNNPIDILGDASPERYADTLQIAASDPNSDGLLVILTPQDMTDPTQTAEQLRRVSQTAAKKPILASWMGGADVAAGEAILNRAGIPTFPYPDTAAQVFNYMWRYTDNLRTIYETPSLPVANADEATNQQRASDLIAQVHAKGRTVLTEYEAKQVFAAYGISTVETRLAASVEEAVAFAEQIGYPVVVKLNSETITHKTDVNGVHLNLANAEAVRQAYRVIQTTVGEARGAEHFQGVTVQPMEKLTGYELIIGSSIDPQFGPVLLFGAGGVLVEVLRDRSLALPPLNTTLARRMMERTRIFEALLGIRGRKPVDIEGLERLLVRFSQLVVEQPWIKEIDVNPLLASPERLLALDARIILHDPALPAERRARLAIRPYPTRHIRSWAMPDGTPLTIRPIRPEDEKLMVAFNQALSPDSIYLRYFHPISAAELTSHEQLARMCFIDYDRETALVVERQSANGERAIVALGQLARLHGTNDAEFAILVTDLYQNLGLGTELLTRLLEIGREEKLERVMAEILPENEGMKRVSHKLGFTLKLDRETRVVHAEIAL